MKKIEQLAIYLAKYETIKQLTNAILDKKNILKDLTKNNNLIKLNIAQYKQLLINQLNEIITNYFLKFTNIPKQLKSIYFDNEKYRDFTKMIIRNKIDNIAYPSIYDYYNDKIDDKDICSAIQYVNNIGNLESEQAIYNLEEEIKQYSWEESESDTLLETNNKGYFLSAFEITDLSKRILFLVAGSKNNITDIIKIDNSTIDILLIDEKLVNMQPYNFYNKEELPRILNGVKISSIKIINDNKSLIKIKFNSENVETNLKFIKEIETEFYNDKLLVNNLKNLAVIKVIDNCYDEVLKYHQTLKNKLQLIFNINDEKQKLEKSLFNQIKKEISLNEEIKKLYDINDKNQNYEIRKIKILIIKNIEASKIFNKN